MGGDGYPLSGVSSASGQRSDAGPAEFEIEETEDEEIQQVLQTLFTSLARRRLIPLSNINNQLTAKEKTNHVYPETII